MGGQSNRSRNISEIPKPLHHPQAWNKVWGWWSERFCPLKTLRRREKKFLKLQALLQNKTEPNVKRKCSRRHWPHAWRPSGPSPLWHSQGTNLEGWLSLHFCPLTLSNGRRKSGSFFSNPTRCTRPSSYPKKSSENSWITPSDSSSFFARLRVNTSWLESLCKGYQIPSSSRRPPRNGCFFKWILPSKRNRTPENHKARTVQRSVFAFKQENRTAVDGEYRVLVILALGRTRYSPK